MANGIIVIDDESVFLRTIRRGLISAGFKDVHTESDSVKAASLFQQGAAFDIALIDIRMPVMDGMELLEVIKNNEPGTECIMITAVNEPKIIVECMKKGAYDYLVKPISRDELILTIRRAMEKKRLTDVVNLYKHSSDGLKLKNPEPFKSIVTKAPKVIRVLKEAELHAAGDISILITGESGTGKELLARAIHKAGPRSEFPYTPINMASHTSAMFDAEFFGYVKGAFTGTEKNRAGYLEYTHGGTMVLDEIGILPPELQGKLLRVLQEGEYIKIGTDKPRQVDIRFIAITNENLEQMVENGTFRKDLYYRLRGAWLHLPPLRERAEDIPLLAEKFLADFCGENKKIRLDEAVMRMLNQYDYPGNIRELKNIIHTAVNIAGGTYIGVQHIPDFLEARLAPLSRKSGNPENSMSSLAEMEKKHILEIYEHTAKNKTQTAKTLGIALNTLRKKLELYGES
jgi:two-component system response regulator AtoC